MRASEGPFVGAPQASLRFTTNSTSPSLCLLQGVGHLRLLRPDHSVLFARLRRMRPEAPSLHCVLPLSRPPVVRVDTLNMSLRLTVQCRRKEVTLFSSALSRSASEAMSSSGAFVMTNPTIPCRPFRSNNDSLPVVLRQRTVAVPLGCSLFRYKGLPPPRESRI